MRIYTDLKMLVKSEKPVVLTIGNFDGVHLGHAFLIDRMRDVAKANNAEIIVLTFANHPQELLKPNKPIFKLTTEAEKCSLMENLGVDVLVVLEFTAQFAALSVEDFFLYISQHMHLSHLILGSDAVLGRNRHGNAAKVMSIGTRMGFDVVYLKPLHIDGTYVSSTCIRSFIERGDFKAAEKLLGRKVAKSE